MYLPDFYPKEKRGWLSSKTTYKVEPSHIAKLIQETKDNVLVETLRYLYNLHGHIGVKDIWFLKYDLTNRLEKYYDQVIKGANLDLTDEQAKLLEESKKSIIDLYESYNSSDD